MKKSRILSLAMAGALCFSLLAGCGGSGGTASSPAPETTSPETGAPESTAPAGGSTSAFKLGGTGPLTGGAAIYGNAAKQGAEIAVEEINALNGDIRFDLRYEDDAHDAEKAGNAYNTLKDWGLQIFLGSVTSTPCVATSSESNADHIFHRRAGRRGRSSDRHREHPPEGQRVPDVLHGPQPGLRFRAVHFG